MKKFPIHSLCMISTKQIKSTYFFYQYHSPKACENAKLSVRVTWHANALVGIAGPKYANESRSAAGDALAPEEQPERRSRTRNMSRSTDFAPRIASSRRYIFSRQLGAKIIVSYAEWIEAARNIDSAPLRF
jgi:hypothetical protein